ncbi:MAG TPA: alcohol dehydrogenase catalytic domain-containing protein [Clostridiaceae bacterium]|nr:alcohol dehydrogenase catalytic domain-containing protein [Clostridiaceae bacterium]
MFAVIMKGPFEIQYENVEEPKIQSGGVIVRINASGICGSDMHRYLGEEPIKDTNKICGHELGGEIIEIADDVKGFNIGQKVAVNPTISCGKCYHCQHGLSYLCDNQRWIPAMTEKVFVPAKCLVPVPNSFDTIYTPLFEPAATAIHTCSGINNKNVVLIGLGTVGLFAMQILEKQGNKVALADISVYSMEQARKLGGKNIVNLSDEDYEDQIFSIFGNNKIDYIIDGVGITSTVNCGIRLVKKLGTVRIVGASRISIEFDCRTALLKEVALESVYIYSEDDYRSAARMIVNDEILYKAIVSKVFPLTEAKKAFEYKKNVPSTKVILKHF